MTSTNAAVSCANSESEMHYFKRIFFVFFLSQIASFTLWLIDILTMSVKFAWIHLSMRLFLAFVKFEPYMQNWIPCQENHYFNLSSKKGLLTHKIIATMFVCQTFTWPHSDKAWIKLLHWLCHGKMYILFACLHSLTTIYSFAMFFFGIEK